jgi:predicted phage tail protein
MSLRKNILLINLKIHSAYSKFFDNNVYTFEAIIASDIIRYLKGVHPKFSKYITQVASGEATEPFCLLDNNLKIINRDMIDIKHFNDGDTIHLVPAIAGGDGKRIRNALLVIAAIYLLSQGVPVDPMTGVAAGAEGAGGYTAVQGAGAATKGLSTMQMIGLQVGLSMVVSMLTKSPAMRESKQTESTTRDNGMFGSLSNSTTSGTPIALIYGQHRVAGQFLSGYVTSITHGSGDPISIGAQFDGI